MIDRFDPRLAKGDPAVMRQYLEAIASKHKIAIRWSANPDEWCAVGNTAVIPPPITKKYGAICVHELAHHIAGRCPRTGEHRARIRGNTIQCLKCEADAWEIGVGLLPFDREMHEQLRAALQTYRRSTPAPLRVQDAADRLMSNLGFAERTLAGLRWQDKLDRQRRANESAARDAAKAAEKRRRFAELQARQDRVRRSL